jgi:hypothetical protein
MRLGPLASRSVLSGVGRERPEEQPDDERHPGDEGAAGDVVSDDMVAANQASDPVGGCRNERDAQAEQGLKLSMPQTGAELTSNVDHENKPTVEMSQTAEISPPSFLRTFTVVWAAAVVLATVGAIVGGTMPDLVTAGCVIVGTGLGFAQVPNKKSQKMADSDLAVFSLAFLAIAALVPSLHTLISHAGYGIAALVVGGLTLGLVTGWDIWLKRTG